MIQTVCTIFGRSAPVESFESPVMKQNLDFSGIDGTTPPLKKIVKAAQATKETTTGRESDDSDYEPENRAKGNNFDTHFENTNDDRRKHNQHDRVARDYYTRSNSPEKRNIDRNFYGPFSLQPYRTDNGVQICNTCNRPTETSQERANALIKIIFNFIVALVLMWMLVTMCYIIWDDVKNKLESKMQIEAARINQCTLDYDTNKCAPHTRLPALEDFCQNLDICRFENPKSVVMTSSTITILVAEVINGLINTLAVKSILVIFGFLFGLSSWGSKRSRANLDLETVRNEIRMHDYYKSPCAKGCKKCE